MTVYYFVLCFLIDADVTFSYPLEKYYMVACVCNVIIPKSPPQFMEFFKDYNSKLTAAGL